MKTCINQLQIHANRILLSFTNLFFFLLFFGTVMFIPYRRQWFYFPRVFLVYDAIHNVYVYDSLLHSFTWCTNIFFFFSTFFLSLFTFGKMSLSCSVLSFRKREKQREIFFFFFFVCVCGECCFSIQIDR